MEPPPSNNYTYTPIELVEVIASHPQLLHQEEMVSKTPFQVSTWMTYLEEIDGLLAETIVTLSTLRQPTSSTSSSSSSSSSSKTLVLCHVRNFVGKRAIAGLPKSYKLWKCHWEFLLTHQQRMDLSDSQMIAMWERALVTLHKFPRVWMEYLTYVHTLITTTTTTTTSTIRHPTFLRRLINRALQALPVTQHDKVWPLILPWYTAKTTATTATAATNNNNDLLPTTISHQIPNDTKVCILRRYLQLDPTATSDMAHFFHTELGHWGEAVLLYQQILNDPYTITPFERRQVWMSMAKICAAHRVEDPTIGIDWNGMVRAAIANPQWLFGSTNNEEWEGILWNQLADSWIRRGEFQLARSVYEEALQSVSRVRDFTILLDAYLQFEEGLLEALMEQQQHEEEEEEEATGEGHEKGEGKVDADHTDEDDDWDILLPSDPLSSSSSLTTGKTSTMSDLELALARAEDLTARRPLLLNHVLLRQNPHDVGEWLKRSQLYKANEQPAQAAAALEEALQTVHARHATGGNPSQLVTALAKIYEDDCKAVDQARDLYDRICNRWVYEFRHAEDLAECYASWVELELRKEKWDDALDIIRRSVIVPSGRSNNNNSKNNSSSSIPKMVRGLAKSLRLWDLLLDLEESLGTVQTAKDAYNRALDQKVATPLHILNFASFLTEHKYFEESFSAYERGIEMFDFPAVKVIWKNYLEAFLKRYGGTKMERTRDLFQRCVDACPPDDSAEFFLMYGKFEEDFGLTKRALNVYQQMCDKVPSSEKYTAYQLFITKTQQYLGVTATRDVYQTAIEALEDAPASQLCLDFSKMEASLHEIDRARAVLVYGAQMADPRRNDHYWKAWNDFEVAHGNEETFREMLRIKRSVEAAFSTVNYNAAEMSGTASQVENLSNEEAMHMIAEREGVELEPESKPIAGFVSATKRSSHVAKLDDVEERVAKLRKMTAAEVGGTDVLNPSNNNNDDEIDIDNLDEEDQEEEEDEARATTAAVKNVSTKAVPAAVFGGLAKLVEGNQGEEESPVGALERLKAAKSSKDS